MTRFSYIKGIDTLRAKTNLLETKDPRFYILTYFSPTRRIRPWNLVIRNTSWDKGERERREERVEVITKRGSVYVYLRHRTIVEF